MREWHIASVSDDFEYRIESISIELGLIVRRTKLKTLPHNLHWHFSMPNRRGVLELTLLIDDRRAWFSVHENRMSDWIDSIREELQRLLKSVS